MSVKISKSGIKRLEVTMRDVMDGLEDAATYMNYQSTPDIVEIISIEPAANPILFKDKVTPLNFPIQEPKSDNIVEYLIQREQKISA